RSDIENPVLWPKALNRQLCSRGLAGVSKCCRRQRTVIVETQVGRRQQGVASPTHHALHWGRDAVGRPACTTGQSPPHRSSLHCRSVYLAVPVSTKTFPLSAPARPC